MKLIAIIVDKLPANCGECCIQNDSFCVIKGMHIGAQWIDREEDSRDKYCPLQVIEVNE